jgi:SAM-dependent methyltransferase
MDIRQSALSRIKQKKELSGIGDSIVLGVLDSYVKRNNLSLEKLKISDIKLIVKDIRAELRYSTGMFQTSRKNRKKLADSEDMDEILKTHSSTKERFNFYPRLKEVINSLKPKSILDLGCGLNPLAIAKPGVTYYACDINLSELEIIRDYFKKHNIKGDAFFCDLRKIDECSVPEADLCLIFKVFDILGKNDYVIAERVLKHINFKNLIVSFSTTTLSGKRMNSPRRIWFEKLLVNLGFKFNTVSSENEIFYIAAR